MDDSIAAPIACLRRAMRVAVNPASLGRALAGHEHERETELARGGMSQLRSHRVRPTVAAFSLAVVATLLLRQFWAGVGADEFSLLRMAEVARGGEFPYSDYWDVRPPLAYLWGLPSAFLEDAGISVALLRILAWFAHAVAGYAFFCLFQRRLGVAAAGVGTIALLATANATDLLAAALPNHFSMATAVVAFALLLLGIRGRRAAHLLSALLVGALPWMMVHSALVASALGALAMFAGPRRLGWLLAAAAPSAVVVGAYWLCGPFDTFARTVFGTPLGVFAMRDDGGYAFFSTTVVWQVLARAPWVVIWCALLIAGAAAFPSACRAAGAASALRLAPYLAAPLAAGFLIMAYAKPPAPPEYWVDMAPVVGLLVAVATAKLLDAPLLRRLAKRLRLSPMQSRAALAMVLSVAVALPVDPWRETPATLPTEFCKDVATRWFLRLRPGDTVLDFTGLCGFHILEHQVAVQPPFVFAPMWWRQFDQPWVGQALEGDGSPAAANARLKRALGLEDASPVATALILADNRILSVIRAQGLEKAFRRHWRLVWFRRLTGADDSAEATGPPNEKLFSRFAVLVRRQWEHGLTPVSAPAVTSP